MDRDLDELVNVAADELDGRLKEEQSRESGWGKDTRSGGTVGQERYGSDWRYILSTNG